MAAIGTTHIGGIERILRVDPSCPDTVDDHVEALTDPHAMWPGLTASSGCMQHWLVSGSSAGFRDLRVDQELCDYPRTGQQESTFNFSLEIIDEDLR